MLYRHFIILCVYRTTYTYHHSHCKGYIPKLTPIFVVSAQSCLGYVQLSSLIIMKPQAFTCDRLIS